MKQQSAGWKPKPTSSESKLRTEDVDASQAQKYVQNQDQ